jgi:transposase
VTDIYLNMVAKLYMEACEAGEWPTKAVAKQLGLERSTANKRVIAARKAGLIPPARAGATPMVRPCCPACGAPPSRWVHAPN